MGGFGSAFGIGFGGFAGDLGIGLLGSWGLGGVEAHPIKSAQRIKTETLLPNELSEKTKDFPMKFILTSLIGDFREISVGKMTYL